MSNRLGAFAHRFNALVFRGALDADWREDQHKRDQGGKFSSTGAGGGGAAGSTEEPSLRQMLGAGPKRFPKERPSGSKGAAAIKRAGGKTQALRTVQGAKHSGAVHSASEWLNKHGGTSATRELSPEQLGNLKSIAGDLLKILRDSGHRQISETKVQASPEGAKAKWAESMQALPSRRRQEGAARGNQPEQIAAKPEKPAKTKQPKAPVDVGAHAGALIQAGTDVEAFNKALAGLNASKPGKEALSEIANRFANVNAPAGTIHQRKFKTKADAMTRLNDVFKQRADSEQKAAIIKKLHTWPSQGHKPGKPLPKILSGSKY